MINCPKGQINPVLFVIVIALCSVLVVTAAQDALASAYAGQTSGSIRLSDVDVAEAAEAGNATMAGATNQTTTNGNTSDVQFLSIQSAQSGSLSQINETAYALELNNVANETILFSDRPARVVEIVSTADFIGNWTTGTNSFSADAPNDALIVENTQTGQLETAIVESFSPIYDTNTNTLTYTIMMENATSIDLPVEFGQSVLVIDSTFINATPGDYS
ncbi:MAG TPA: hypothetical protein VE130_09505 [Nitrososphaeraceae archaeon]|jgi:hypothetical protein|nr:hypothetical protein [Nitrososphaeraceae archaeon]